MEEEDKKGVGRTETKSSFQFGTASRNGRKMGRERTRVEGKKGLASVRSM
jgi:hypothetical protein